MTFEMYDPSQYKPCKKCGEMKHKNEFHRHPHDRLKRQPTCKVCISNDTERYERQKARDQRERAENPEKVRDRYLKNIYGISLDQYNALVAHQNGCCAICKNPTDDLHVDHDHATDMVRALLCGKCNRGIGMFDDDPATLREAADYLESFSVSVHCTVEDMAWLWETEEDMRAFIAKVESNPPIDPALYKRKSRRLADYD